MKAAYIEETGSPDVIRYGDVPDPHCGPDQALIQMGAVSVNPIDTYIRNGANYWPLPKPFIVGCDVAVRSSKWGPTLRHLEPGQKGLGEAIKACWGAREPFPLFVPSMPPGFIRFPMCIGRTSGGLRLVGIYGSSRAVS